MRKKTAALIALASVIMLVAACDQVKDARDKIDTAKNAVEAIASSDLAPEKVKEFAKLALEIEKDPSKAEKLLADHEISAEDFQKTLKTIQDNPKLAELFEQAKKTAGQ